MTATTILLIAIVYFSLLFAISFITGKDNSDSSFFVGNRKSPWFIVAFGMVGAMLSGITFISVPGWVGSSQFSYLQVVLGNVVGYAIIALVLLPLYYRMNLTSIYEYLKERFGIVSYRTGALFFLLSRIIGAALRLYLVAEVLQYFVFGQWGIPYWFTVVLTIALIWLYTFRGGIKTIVWTDTLQTLFILISVGLTLYYLSDALGENIIQQVSNSDYSQIFFFEDGWSDSKNFFKRFFAGIFLAIAMVGLDQDMMQKNISCKDLSSAQKNMFTSSTLFLLVSSLFLFLGACLYLFAQSKGIDIPTKVVAGEVKSAPDLLFPEIAINHLPVTVGLFFIVGLLAAAYSSADSALTSLTTSFCVDFLGFNEHNSNKKTRYLVHFTFSVILALVIIIFHAMNNESVVWQLFKLAGYTYGPLLGMFFFGLLTKRYVKDNWVIVVCLVSCLISYLLNTYSVQLFLGYKFDFELLIVNGLITAFGLFLISYKNDRQTTDGY